MTGWMDGLALASDMCKPLNGSCHAGQSFWVLDFAIAHRIVPDIAVVIDVLEWQFHQKYVWYTRLTMLLIAIDKTCVARMLEVE